MTKHTERLMSRASVVAMAAFAKDPVSTLPDGAERVEDTPAAGGTGQRPDPIDGLSAEEQAGIDAMRGEDAGGDNVDHGADAAAGGGADPDGDGGTDGDLPAPGDGESAPAAADGAVPRATPKTINYGRHQKEVAKLQKERDDAIAALDGSRKETATEREARTRLDERSRLLLEAINTKAAPAAAAAPAADADPEPDEGDDPIGHSQWKIRKLEKTVADLSSGQQRREQATVAETEEKQVYDSLIGDIQRVAAADPTMTDAFVHLRETRYQELGFIYAHIDITDPAQCATLSPADQTRLSKNIQDTFHNEQMLVARQSIAAGKSPAQVIRNLATARGWKPAAPAAPAAGEVAAPAKTNGAAAPAVPAARAAPAGSVKDQLNAVRDNLDASRSLSDAGGSPGGQMTPERLASMPEREFLQYYESMKDSGQLDSLMGRPDNM